MAASRAELIIVRWNARGVVNYVTKFGEDVNTALLVANVQSTDATERKLTIIKMELKDIFEQPLTQLKMNSRTTIFYLCGAQTRQ